MSYTTKTKSVAGVCSSETGFIQTKGDNNKSLHVQVCSMTHSNCLLQSKN